MWHFKKLVSTTFIPRVQEKCNNSNKSKNTDGWMDDR